MNGAAFPLLGGNLLLLGVTLSALAIAVHAARKWRRELGSQVRGAIMRDREYIARELHDVVAHHVTVMIAGASAARRCPSFGDATLALGNVETVGRDALAELRRLLGRLRIEPEDTGPPGLDQLPKLMTRVEQAGLPVRLTMHGDPRPLPAAVDADAYRIIQEALTNALKHAGPTRADLVVAYHPDALRLWIHDFGPGAATPSGGYGLDGMRHRVTRLGGTIAMGPGPGAGFQIAVDLPVNQ